MLMGTAISATACHQKEEYPSVPEVTEPQPTGEIIPTVDRQKELKDACQSLLSKAVKSCECFEIVSCFLSVGW